LAGLKDVSTFLNKREKTNIANFIEFPLVLLQTTDFAKAWWEMVVFARAEKTIK